MSEGEGLKKLTKMITPKESEYVKTVYSCCVEKFLSKSDVEGVFLYYGHTKSVAYKVLSKQGKKV